MWKGYQKIVLVLMSLNIFVVGILGANAHLKEGGIRIIGDSVQKDTYFLNLLVSVIIVIYFNFEVFNKKQKDE